MGLLTASATDYQVVEPKLQNTEDQEIKNNLFWFINKLNLEFIKNKSKKNDLSFKEIDGETCFSDNVYSSNIPQEVYDLQNLESLFTSGELNQAKQVLNQIKDKYPKNQKLEKYLTLLSPSKLSRKKAFSKKNIRLSQDWVQKNYQQYFNQWVALLDGKLVLSSPLLSDLKNEIKSIEGIYIIYIK